MEEGSFSFLMLFISAQYLFYFSCYEDLAETYNIAQNLARSQRSKYSNSALKGLKHFSRAF